MPRLMSSGTDDVLLGKINYQYLGKSADSILFLRQRQHIPRKTCHLCMKGYGDTFHKILIHAVFLKEPPI